MATAAVAATDGMAARREMESMEEVEFAWSPLQPLRRPTGASLQSKMGLKQADNEDVEMLSEEEGNDEEQEENDEEQEEEEEETTVATLLETMADENDDDDEFAPLSEDEEEEEEDDLDDEDFLLEEEDDNEAIDEEDSLTFVEGDTRYWQSLEEKQAWVARYQSARAAYKQQHGDDVDAAADALPNRTRRRRGKKLAKRRRRSGRWIPVVLAVAVACGAYVAVRNVEDFQRVRNVVLGGVSSTLAVASKANVNAAREWITLQAQHLWTQVPMWKWHGPTASNELIESEDQTQHLNVPAGPATTTPEAVDDHQEEAAVGDERFEADKDSVKTGALSEAGRKALARMLKDCTEAKYQLAKSDKNQEAMDTALAACSKAVDAAPRGSFEWIQARVLRGDVCSILVRSKLALAEYRAALAHTALHEDEFPWLSQAIELKIWASRSFGLYYDATKADEPKRQAKLKQLRRECKKTVISDSAAPAARTLATNWLRLFAKKLPILDVLKECRGYAMVRLAEEMAAATPATTTATNT